MSERVFAIVPAAGVGRRMASATPKQYLPLLGQCVLEHTLAALLAIPAIDSVTVAIAADDHHWATLPVANDTRVHAVAGGAERAHSVMNAMASLPATARVWVLVHDAVRPCVQPAWVMRLLDAVQGDAVGGLLALPLADTLKQAKEGRVSMTIDRTALWAAQTPQVFRYGVLRPALEQALAAGDIVTDESSAVERAGFSPRLVEGDAANLKINRPADLSLAAYWLQSSKENS